jgi:hypothetical protein
MTTQAHLAFVVLRDQHDDDGTRRLEAEWRMGGAIVIEGRDVGPGVEQFWGEGNRRYEWEWAIDAEAIPAMIAALGGAPGDDPLALLKAWYDAGDGRDPGIHLYDDARVTSSLLCECGERAAGQELVEAEHLAVEDPVG